MPLLVICASFYSQTRDGARHPGCSMEDAWHNQELVLSDQQKWLQSQIKLMGNKAPHCEDTKPASKGNS